MALEAEATSTVLSLASCYGGEVCPPTRVEEVIGACHEEEERVGESEREIRRKQGLTEFFPC